MHARENGDDESSFRKNPFFPKSLHHLSRSSQFPSFIFPSDGRHNTESVDRQIRYRWSHNRRQFLATFLALSKKPGRAEFLFLASRTIRCAVTRMDPRLNSPPSSSSLQSISVIRERIRERRGRHEREAIFRFLFIWEVFPRRFFFLAYPGNDNSSSHY